MSEPLVKVEVSAGEVQWGGIGGSAWQKLSDELKQAVKETVAAQLGPLVCGPDPNWYAAVTIELKRRN